MPLHHYHQISPVLPQNQSKKDVMLVGKEKPSEWQQGSLLWLKVHISSWSVKFRYTFGFLMDASFPIAVSTSNTFYNLWLGWRLLQYSLSSKRSKSPCFLLSWHRGEHSRATQAGTNISNLPPTLHTDFHRISSQVQGLCSCLQSSLLLRHRISRKTP